MRQVKKGDIIVRTNNYGSSAKIGKMYESTGSGWNNSSQLHGGWSIREDYYRFATPKEIEYFNKGVKNVDNIPKVSETYEIY